MAFFCFTSCFISAIVSAVILVHVPGRHPRNAERDLASPPRSPRALALPPAARQLTSGLRSAPAQGAGQGLIDAFRLVEVWEAS